MMEYVSLYSSLCANFSLHQCMGYMGHVGNYVRAGVLDWVTWDVLVSHAGQRCPGITVVRAGIEHKYSITVVNVLLF